MFGAIQKDVREFMLRITSSLDRVDDLITETQMLLRDARVELNDIRNMRRSVQKALSAEPKNE